MTGFYVVACAVAADWSNVKAGHYSGRLSLQVRGRGGSGNCLFHSFMRGVAVRRALDSDASWPYFPARYLRRMVAVFLCNHRQLVMKMKGASLGAEYGVERNDVGQYHLSYKEFIIRTLDRSFWGDDTHLYALAKMFRTTITVVNWSGERITEQRVLHDRHLSDVDIVLVYDGTHHFHGAGEW